MAQVSYIETGDLHIEKEVYTAHMSNMSYHHAYELDYLYHGEWEYFIGDGF